MAEGAQGMAGVRASNDQRDIAAALAALAQGRLDAFKARDVDLDCVLRIGAKDQDRYLVESTGPGGVRAREEWRSGRWIELALARGNWLLTGAPPPAAAPAPTEAAGDQAATPGLSFRKPVRGGEIRVELPVDATAEESLAAARELDRIAAVLRAMVAT